MNKYQEQEEVKSSFAFSVDAKHEALPSLQEFWDALAYYAFTPSQGQAEIALFLRLQAIAEHSPEHDGLMSGFWDCAFDSGPRPARPRSS
ncbi:hypothetical protein [Paraburkholderia sp. BCC1884]|uniref:hypothetical protein n=1 Tax=Paraburkholderia sp. BCC1884 TaxID=2562668 RepID=UPI00118381D7|nr:hypothetical protein [Paraburkholderia sp. BCC1884]